MAKELTNKQFSQEDSKFLIACGQNNIEPTTRQASKWRNKKGSAYKNYNPKKEVI